MERLTIDEVIEHCERTIERTENIVRLQGLNPQEETLSKNYWEHKQTAEWLKELKEYKQLEEQGLLRRLPCKTGDTIYVIPSETNFKLNIINRYEENNRVYKQVVNEVRFYTSGHYLLTTCEGWCSALEQFFGITWFLTREEAETALEKMKGCE